MKNYIKKLNLFFLFLAPAFLPAEPLYSSTWGFFLDLPESYEFVEGNDIDRYSFQGPLNVKFDIAVYRNVYRNIEQLSADVKRRLGNTGDTAFFEYGTKAAALIELNFGDFAGWALCVELDGGGTNGIPQGGTPQGGTPPLFVALSYAPKKINMDLYHLSALNSLAPSEAERRLPGPIMEFGFPRGQLRKETLAGTGLSALIREHDAEAAQALVDREFALLSHYQSTPVWQEAWIRFYRAIYRDSRDRIADAVLQLERNWNKNTGKRAFAEKALAFVQGFTYERDPGGSDFVNLVSAVTEGRGDCDSRAMLWAMILIQADIPAAIMVSRQYSHAMGLADVPGIGARFKAGGINWLVAETTTKLDIGRINKDMSNTEAWLGILFE